MKAIITKNLPLLFAIFVALGMAFMFYAVLVRLAELRPLPPSVTIVRDTSYQQHSSQLPAYQPPIIVSQPPAAIPPQYKPDTSYMGLLRQYQATLNELLATNVSRDTIRLDSIGYVAITDSIRQNRIAYRLPSYHYRVPVITNTITIREPHQPTRQLYLGTGLSAGQNWTFGGVEGGMLYKTKTDRIYGTSIHWSPQYGLSYSARLYWPLMK